MRPKVVSLASVRELRRCRALLAMSCFATTPEGDETIVFGAAGQRTLMHGIGKVPEGWLLADRNAPVDVRRVAWTADTITLEASGPVTIKAVVVPSRSVDGHRFTLDGYISTNGGE